MFGIAIEPNEAGAKDKAFFVSGEILTARHQYQDFEFSFYHRHEGPARIKVLFTGKVNIWLDFVDFIPVEPDGSESDKAGAAVIAAADLSGG